MSIAAKDRDCLPPPRVHAWLTPPASGWRRRARGLAASGLSSPLVAMAALLVSLAVSLVVTAVTGVPLWPLQLMLVIAAAGVLLAIRARVRRQLLEPLTYLRHWALRMRGGNLAARIPEPQAGEFGLLAADINALSGSLCALSRDLEGRVQLATERLAQKTRSLEILYDVAATLNASSDLGELLTRFLHTLKDVVDARAAAVRLLTPDGDLRLVASDGLDPEVVERERLVPSCQCLCGRVAIDGTVQFRTDLGPCRETVGRPLLSCDENVEMVAVPLAYRGRTLGVYNLFVERPAPFAREDLRELLTSIGRHLGMAIEKARLDDESRRLALMEERTLLAHELHDSLAQTLASLRFQMRTLLDTLDAGQPAAARIEAERLAGGLDEAHTELRELLAQFRTPMDERGLVPAIEGVVESFGRETGINIFFQQEWSHAQLPPIQEMQVLRIVQEALANVRKHARAQCVRVILHHDPAARDFWVLVEDDGVGVDRQAMASRPGEHVGLSIMRDRARRLDGQLHIESDAGEGTRVRLSFPQPQVAALHALGP